MRRDCESCGATHSGECLDENLVMESERGPRCRHGSSDDGTCMDCQDEHNAYTGLACWRLRLGRILDRTAAH